MPETKNTTNRWRMRSEDRSTALIVAERVLAWLVGIDDLPAGDIEDLKLDWQTRLIQGQESPYEEEMWEAVCAKRAEIARMGG